MRLRSQISIFNVLTRLLLIVILVFTLPLLVERVVYRHIDKTLQEKKQKFIHNLGQAEINAFLKESSQSDTYASFSVLHDEFILLSRLAAQKAGPPLVFVDEPRIIEGQQGDYRILQYRFSYGQKYYELEVGSSVAEISDLTFMIRIFTLVVLLAIVLLTFVIDSLFIDYLLRPFYRIIDTKIRRVNHVDSFNFAPVNSPSADFRELDEVLNQMMVRIDSHFRQEKQFIANVSHELLTPISLLKNRFENLLQNTSLDEAATDKLVASLRTLDRLSKTINNLLLISRIENKQFTGSELVDIKGLFGEVFAEMEDRILEKNIQWRDQLDGALFFAGNKTLLHILIYNLVSNAIKYNKEGGAIVLKSVIDFDGFHISVADTGHGLQPEQAAKIFDRFTRFDNGQEGQGLGLAIAQSIAGFHGILLTVESTVGEGTTFSLFFPKT